MCEFWGSHSNVAEDSRILYSAFQLMVRGGSSVGRSNYLGIIISFNNFLVLRMLIVLQKLFLNVHTSFISICCTKLSICAILCFGHLLQSLSGSYSAVRSCTE